MKIHGFCLLLLLTANPSWAAVVPSTDDDEELAQKISELDKKISDLRARSKELILERKTLQARKLEKERLLQEELRKKQEEEARREEEEKKHHFARVEVNGKLVSVGMQNPGRWQIVVKDVPWELDFAAHPELLTTAGQLVGKGVILKGTLVNTKTVVPGHWSYPPVSPPTLPHWQPPYGPVWPKDDWGLYGRPPYEGTPPPSVPRQPEPQRPPSYDIPLQQVQPRQPDPTQPYLIPSYETTVVTITVESLKLAER